MVVKDVLPQHPWFRYLVGRRVLRREEKVLGVVGDLPHVPALLGRVDGDAILQQFMAGSPMVRGAVSEELVLRVCQKLREQVAALHARGVVHLDLRQYRNILVDERGTPSIIDFESAFLLGRTWWGRGLHRFLTRLDRAAILKLQARFGYETLTEEQRARFRRQEWLSNLWIFHRFGPLVRWLLGRRRQRDSSDDQD